MQRAFGVEQMNWWTNKRVDSFEKIVSSPPDNAVW